MTLIKFNIVLVFLTFSVLSTKAVSNDSYIPHSLDEVQDALANVFEESVVLKLNYGVTIATRTAILKTKISQIELRANVSLELLVKQTQENPNCLNLRTVEEITGTVDKLKKCHVNDINSAYSSLEDMKYFTEKIRDLKLYEKNLDKMLRRLNEVYVDLGVRTGKINSHLHFIRRGSCVSDMEKRLIDVFLNFNKSVSDCMAKTPK